MLEYSLQQWINRVTAAMLLLVISGACQALVARVAGDRGPYHDGRVTLNPWRHLDAVGTLSAVLFSFGWPKPLSLTVEARRSRRSIAIAVAVAGPLSILLAAGFAAFARPLLVRYIPGPAGFAALSWATTCARMGAAMFVLNLIPIPPLSASVAWYSVTPRVIHSARRAGLWIGVALALLAALGVLDALLRPILEPLLRSVGLDR